MPADGLRSSERPGDGAWGALDPAGRPVAVLGERPEDWRRWVDLSYPLLAILDRDGRFCRFSTGWAAALGCARAELEAVRLADLAHPADSELVQAELAKLAGGESVRRWRSRLRGKDGAERWMTWTAIADAKGEHIQLIATDGTEPGEEEAGAGARAAKGAVQAGEGGRQPEAVQFRHLVENITDVVFTMDSVGGVAYVSPVVERLFGYVPAEIIGSDPRGYVEAETLPALERALLKARTGASAVEEFRVRRKDGTPRWVRMSVHPILENGAVVRLQGIATDITEAKLFEQNIQRRLEALTDPDVSLADARIEELIDLDAVRGLMQSFHAITGAVSALLNPQEDVLIAVGWQDLCTRFHRVHPGTCARCKASDAYIKTHLAEVGEDGYVAYRCANGLWDMAIPIRIRGRHLATFFFGQTFLDDEPIDRELFRRQAMEFGFDVTAYLDAVGRVPVISRAQLSAIMRFFGQFVDLIAAMGIKNVAQARNIAERNRITEALRESEKRYRGLFDGVPVGLFRTTPTLGFMDANEALLKMLGHASRESLLAVRASDLWVDPAVYEQWRTGMEQEDVARGVEARWRRNDGAIIAVRLSSRAVRDAEGRVQWYEGSVEDITDRKRGEERTARLNRLKEQLLGPLGLEEKLKLVTEEVVSVFDADFARVWITRPGDRCLSGCRHAAVTGGPHACRDRSTCLHLVASSGRYAHLDGDHGRVPLGCYKIGRVASEVDFGFVTNDVTHDPRVHDHAWARSLGLASFAGYRLLSTEGRAIGVLALFSKHALTPDEQVVLQDLANTTSQVIVAGIAEEALRDSEERFRSTFEHAAIGIAHVAPDGRWLRVNQRLGDIIGYSREELPARTFQELADPDDVAADLENVRRVLVGEIPSYSAERRYIRKDGVPVWANLTVSLVRRSTGQAKYLIFVLEDISARKRIERDRQNLEAQLQRAQRLESIAQLAGGLAHDFNNILTIIQGNAELARAALPDSAAETGEAAAALGQIEQGAQRAAGLTRQLLAFSRRQPAQPQLVDLNQVVTGLEPMLARLLRENITVTISPGRQLKTAKVDPGQIEQVIMNLVVNARDAMPDGGRLAIETANAVLDEGYVATHAEARTGPHVMLSVSDTGCGMDAATRELIFDPFFTTKGAGEGTGLGLAVVYGIVKQAGGHVHVYSEPGCGSTFKVYLPAQDEPMVKPMANLEDSAPPTGNETILICEDNDAVRQVAVRFLEGAGYAVLAAASGAEAQRLMSERTEPIDLLVTDVVMADTNGRRLADALAGTCPGLKTLFISGYTANVISHHGVLDEGVEFLEKPFTRAAFLQRVREVLDKQPNAAQK